MQEYRLLSSHARNIHEIPVSTSIPCKKKFHSQGGSTFRWYHPLWDRCLLLGAYSTAFFYMYHTARKLKICQISDRGLDVAWLISFAVTLLNIFLQWLVGTNLLLYARIGRRVIDFLCHLAWRDCVACISHKQCSPSSRHHSSNHSPYPAILLDSYIVGCRHGKKLRMFESWAADSGPNLQPLSCLECQWKCWPVSDLGA